MSITFTIFSARLLLFLFPFKWLQFTTDPGPFVQLGCGTISGALGATCVYPLQVIRTRYKP